MRILIGLCVCAAAVAQTAPAGKPRLTFEVASIKPAEPLSAEKMVAGQQRITVNVDAARVDFQDVSMAELIRAAYKVRLYQISGPDWIKGTRFDVVAKLPDGAKTDQVPEMLQSLLEDRFHLEIHNSSKEMPVYVLTVGKDGPKLKESQPDENADPANADKTSANSGGGKERGITPMTTSGPNGSARMMPNANGMHIDLKDMNITSMVDWLARFSDRPVIDQTNLTGRYDVELDVSRDEMMAAARAAGVTGVDTGARRGPDSASEPGGDSIFASMQRVGLKLEPRRMPVPLLVVDRIEKTASEN